MPANRRWLCRRLRRVCDDAGRFSVLSRWPPNTTEARWQAIGETAVVWIEANNEAEAEEFALAQVTTGAGAGGASKTLSTASKS